MLGSATLAMVVSSTCITVASMMQTVMSGRFDAGSVRAAASAMASSAGAAPAGCGMRGSPG